MTDDRAREILAGLSSRERKAMSSLEEMGTAPERVIEALIRYGLVAEYDVAKLGGFDDHEAYRMLRQGGIALVVNLFTESGEAVRRIMAENGQ